MLGYWRACPRKFWWRHIRNLAPKGSNIHLHAGGAFAKGLEAARKAFYSGGCSPDEAIAQGQIAIIKSWGSEDPQEDNAKSLGRVLGGLDFYLHEAFPIATDYIVPFLNPSTHVPMVECSFGIPLDEVLHPVTKDPILYAGRFDMLGVHKTDQVLFIEDDKTTTQLGASWASRWTLRSQFTGYVWGAQHFGLPVAGAIIRGISFLKNGYDKAESIQMRPQWMIDRWYQQVINDLNDMKRAWESDSWNYNLDESCAAYGGCPYLRLCDVRDPEPFLDVYYEESHWNPLQVKETA
jgi:hypothetical protein